MDDYQNQYPNPNPQSQFPEPSSPRRYFWLIIFVMAIVGGLASAGVWYWQKQQLAKEVVTTFTPRPTDETANWKIYRNDQYGFEFKYPREFINSVEIGKNKLEREGYIFFISLGNISDDQITISIFDREFNPNNILTTYGHFESNESQKINIGDRIAYKYQEGDGGCQALITQTSLSTNTFEVSFSYCSGADTPENYFPIHKNNELINQILSTFKFTK